MNNKEKNLYATLIINSLNEAAARALLCDIPFDIFMEDCRECYNFQKELSLEEFSLPSLPLKEKVDHKKDLTIKVGQVYEVSDYGLDGVPGVCVIVRVAPNKIYFRWLKGRYSNDSYQFDAAGQAFFDRPAVKLIQENPDPAPGQIWRGSISNHGGYYLILKRCAENAPYNSYNKGWEVIASGDLDSEFRWLNDENWSPNWKSVTFVGYKDDLDLEKNEEIDNLINA